MENPRLDMAINLLKQCKARGMQYYDAAQGLAKQGFSQEEIEQASNRFPYSSIAPADNNPIKSAEPASVYNKESADKAELEAAKQRMNRGYWYQFIPIVGAFYKFKQIDNYAEYESKKTGHSWSTVMLIWGAIMVVGSLLVMTVAPAAIILFSNNPSALHLLPYVGPTVIILLLLLFRARKH